MRVLLDENLPIAFARALVGHDVTTVRELGSSGMKNGELLRRAAGQIEAFITMDANLQFQQRLQGVPFGVIVLRARSNRMADLLGLAPKVLATLSMLQPGTVQIVGG